MFTIEQKRNWVLNQFKEIPATIISYLENEDNVEFAYSLFRRLDSEVGFDVGLDQFYYIK